MSLNFSDYDRMKDPGWFIPFAVNVILLLAALWVLISLIHHGIQTGKWKNTKTNTAERLNKGLVYTVVVFTAMFCFIRLLFSLIFMNVGFTDNENLVCGVFVELLAITYACNIGSAMIFLWLRQRIFFTNFLLRVSYSKFTKTFSVASILIILIGGFVGFLVVRILTIRFSSSLGCMAVFPSEGIVLYLVLIFCLTTFGQCTLLSLFIYALTKTKISEQEEPDLNSSTSVTSINSVLRRTFIVAVFSIVTDALLPWSAFVWNIPRAVTAVYNINSFLNMILVIFSFADFKQMFFSPCF